MIVGGIKETKVHQAIQDMCRYQKRKRSTNSIKGIIKVPIRVSPKIKFRLPLLSSTTPIRSSDIQADKTS